MRKPKNIDAYLTKRFYDPHSPGSFTSVTKLYDVIKEEGRYSIPLERVKKWGEGQDIVTLHKTVRQRQPAYRRVISPGLNHMWDADLLVLTGKRFVESNSRNNHILVTIDVFSRICRAEPVKNKGGKEMERAFSAIFERSGIKPRFLRTDRGVEFSNGILREFFRRNGVRHYFANTESKANYSEIMIKTLKKKLFQYFQNTNSYSYEKDLQSIVDSYNNTVHSSIGIAPSRVNEANWQKVWDYQYVSNSSNYKDSLKRALKTLSRRRRRPTKGVEHPYKFSVGQTVRVARYRQKPFDRAYDEQFTGEIFTVRSRRIYEGIPVYRLFDFGGEPIEGHFYSGELTPVKYDPDALFKIEKVLKTRRRNGVLEKLVKYQSWPKKYNEWVAARSIVDLPVGRTAGLKRKNKKKKKK